MTHHNQSALRGLINELLNGDEELPRGEAMRRLLETSLQELIEAELTVTSGAEGVGTQLSITIPLARPQESARNREAE